MKAFLFAAAAVSALVASSTASAANVAIVKGSFYTEDLKNQLSSKGHSVTEIETYTGASLASFDAVVHYGNSFTDAAALETYVSAGGRLVLTPWSGLNFAVPANLQVFQNGGNAIFTQLNPAINVLDPSSSLLDGVSFPSAGTVNIGRISNIGFTAGAAQIASWGDGSALLGLRSFGSGSVVGINLHLITSDTAYQVVNTPWASQLASNAVGGALTAPVPEPATWAMMIAGFGLAGTALRRRRVSVSFA